MRNDVTAGLFGRDVLVVMVSTNDARWLPACFATLAASEGQRVDALLVCNACTDDSALAARSATMPIDVVRTSHKYGFAEASNIGLRRAVEGRYRYVMLLNPDTQIHPRAIESLVSFLDEHSDYGIVGSRQIAYDDADWKTPNRWTIETIAHAKQLGHVPRRVGRYTILEHFYVQGAALLARVDLLRSIGLLDPVYGTFYEETDLCRRCRLSGARVAIVFDSLVRHYEGGHWRRDRTTEIEREALFLRNQYIYFLSGERRRIARWLIAGRLFREHMRRMMRTSMLPLQRYPQVLTSVVRATAHVSRLRQRNTTIQGGLPIDDRDHAIGSASP